mgnify:CR=1 FL=1
MTMDQIIEFGLYQIISMLYAQLLPSISHTKSQFFFTKLVLFWSLNSYCKRRQLLNLLPIRKYHAQINTALISTQLLKNKPFTCSPKEMREDSSQP